MCLRSAFDIEIIDSYNQLQSDPQIVTVKIPSNSADHFSRVQQYIADEKEIVYGHSAFKKKDDQCCASPSPVLDSERAEYICENCGCVIADHDIDRGKDWRPSNKEGGDDVRCRSGPAMNPFIHDGGMTTRIGGGLHDGNRKIDAKSDARNRRLIKWNKRWMMEGREQKNFTDAMDELKKYANMFELPIPVQKEIAHLYKQSIKNQCMKHKTIKSTVLAFIYIMCQRHKIPKDISEITGKGSISKKEFNRYRHRVMGLLNIRNDPAKPEDYLNKIYEALKIDDHTIYQVSHRILQKVHAQKGATLQFSVGKDPSGIAAAAVYLTCVLKKYKRTQQQISKVANITEVTLRQRYQGLCHILGFSPTKLRGDEDEEVVQKAKHSDMAEACRGYARLV